MAIGFGRNLAWKLEKGHQENKTYSMCKLGIYRIDAAPNQLFFFALLPSIWPRFIQALVMIAKWSFFRRKKREKRWKPSGYLTDGENLRWQSQIASPLGCGCHGNRMFSLERRDKMEIKVNAAHYSSDVRGGRLLIAVGGRLSPFRKRRHFICQSFLI